MALFHGFFKNLLFAYNTKASPVETGEVFRGNQSFFKDFLVPSGYWITVLSSC